MPIISIIRHYSIARSKKKEYPLYSKEMVKELQDNNKMYLAHLYTYEVYFEWCL